MEYSERSKIIVLKLKIFFDFGVDNVFRIIFAQHVLYLRKQVNVNPL